MSDTHADGQGSEQSFVSVTCGGETCVLCGAPAANKVGEEIPFDHPHRDRHNATAYVCAHHFDLLMSATYRRENPAALRASPPGPHVLGRLHVDTQARRATFVPGAPASTPAEER